MSSKFPVGDTHGDNYYGSYYSNNPSFDDIPSRPQSAPLQNPWHRPGSGAAFGAGPSGPPGAADHLGKVPGRPSYFDQVAAISLGLGNLFAEHLLSYPCVVLRRQCQVNHAATVYHLTPFTLFPTMISLQQNQGILCLWKGASSSILLHALEIGVETILADFAGLPKQVARFSSMSSVGSHILLKTISYTITCTFGIASVLESVQSDVANSRLSLFEFLHEGFARLRHDITGPRDSRRIPIWYLLAPSVGFRLGHYLLSGVTHYVMHSVVRRQILQRRPEERTLFDSFFPDIFAAFTSHLLADAILFPVETVLYRLYAQGTRTIIDNLDTGLEVIPITTRYEGVVDAVSSIYSSEGLLGFYKGVGALMLQYALHLAMLRAIRFVFVQIESSNKSNENLQSVSRLPDPTTTVGPSVSNLQFSQRNNTGHGQYSGTR